MKKLILTLATFTLAFSLYAQEDLRERYEYLVTRSFFSYENKIKATEELLQMAQTIASQNGIESSIEYRVDIRDMKTSYPILVITPKDNLSIANTEANRVFQKFGGLKLFVSPYDLKMNKISAFFIPSGEGIGAPYDFIFNQLSEPYWHELEHAQTFLDIIQRKDDHCAGYFKIEQGHYLSKKNTNYYNRFVSLDEHKVSLFSAQYRMKELIQLYHQTPKEIFYTRDNEEKLSYIHHLLEVVEATSAQVSDICLRAKDQILRNQYQVIEKTLFLGKNLEANIFSVKIKIDSYESHYNPKAPSDRYLVIPDGGFAEFYSLKTTPEYLIQRLEKLSEEAKLLNKNSKEAKDIIYLRILYPDLEKTDLDKLAAKVLSIFN